MSTTAQNLRIDRVLQRSDPLTVCQQIQWDNGEWDTLHTQPPRGRGAVGGQLQSWATHFFRFIFIVLILLYPGRGWTWQQRMSPPCRSMEAKSVKLRRKSSKLQTFSFRLLIGAEISLKLLLAHTVRRSFQTTTNEQTLSLSNAVHFSPLSVPLDSQMFHRLCLFKLVCNEAHSELRFESEAKGLFYGWNISNYKALLGGLYVIIKHDEYFKTHLLNVKLGRYSVMQNN